MKHEFDTINYEWLTATTGDPFCDLGGYVIKELEANFPDKGILDLIEYVTDIYIDKWNAKIWNFFPNSKIDQPKFSVEKKRKETILYFQSLLEELNFKELGYCRITGQFSKLFIAWRHNSILSGSGSLINFHHYFESGLLISKEALIRYYFMPLGCELLQGQIIVIHSNNEFVSEFFARNNCKKNLHAILLGMSSGVLVSNSKSLETLLFRFIDKLLMELNFLKKNIIDNTSITLYHFTNDKRKPNVDIYRIPNSIFRFYCFTQTPKYKVKWNNFICFYYIHKNKKNQYEKIEDKEKKIISSINEDDFYELKNKVYTYLFHGKSILCYIIEWVKNNDFAFDLVIKYQTLVRNMKKETTLKIEEMVNALFDINDQDGMIKMIKRINNLKTSTEFRRFIIGNIISKYIPKNNKPILTVDEYREDLFGENISWQEIRDIFLIAIYQKLHEESIYLDSSIDEEEDIE